MLNLPVCWSEGMFLRPQHFQASDRFWMEQLGQSSQFDTPFHYGFATLQLQRDAIGRGEFGLLRAGFRMRDGSLWNLDETQCPERVSLKAALDRQETVIVYLAIPHLQGWAQNVSQNGDDSGTRYALTEVTQRDENGAGDPQSVELRRPNFRLMLSTDDLKGYETLPVARLRRSSDGQAAAVLDETFIPPLLNTATWTELSAGIIRALHDRMMQKIDVFGTQLRDRKSAFGTQEQGELERVMFLHQLNEHAAALGVVLRADGIHPFWMYLELSRILGALSIFLPERTVGDVRNYDHDDLGTVFGWMKEEIILRLEAVPIKFYETSRFIGTSHGMEANLRPRWLEERWTWYVGAGTPDIGAQELVDFLKSSKFQWVLGSAGTASEIFNRAGSGLLLKALSQVPSPLPGSQGWTYFEVTKDGPVWDAVRRENSLAMRFQLNVIDDAEHLPGSGRITLNIKSRSVRVKFGLFAVPTE